jgi:hypothetical protein
VSFNPTGNGFKTGTLTLGHGGTGSAPVVNLFATGLIKADLKVSPLELDFHSVIVGKSFGQPVTLTNGGSKPLSITAFNLTGDYSQSNDCSAPLQPNSSCTVTVTFTPRALGTRDGTVTISHSGAGSAQVIPLTGVGRTSLQLNPTQIEFGNQKVGTTSSWHFLSISNNSSSPVTLSNISISGDFAIAQNPCGSVVQPFFGCALQIVFTPKRLGQTTGNVTVLASDSVEAHIVPLSGNGAGFGTGSSTQLAVDPSFPFVGQTIAFTANVLPGASGTPTGKVTFNDGATLLNVAQMNNGQAKFSTSTLLPGSHLITALYSGDDDFIGSTSSTQTLTVSKASTSSTLTSTPNPSSAGQSVTFSASVSASAGGTATGTVDFLDGTIIIGSANIASGKATLTTTPGQGLHPMSSTYRGDAKHLASVSRGVPQLVNAPGLANTSVTLTNASATKIFNRGTIQLRVAVTSSSGTPGGTVIFMDGATRLGSAVLDGTGRASFSTNQLTVGEHRIAAVYVGNGAFAGNVSSSLTIQRSPRPR